MAYSWQYNELSDDFPDSARGALSPRRNKPKTSGPLQRVPKGLQRNPGTGWEGAEQFAQDIARATDLAVGVAEMQMDSLEGRDQYGSTMSAREATPLDIAREVALEREASYAPGRSRNLQDLEGFITRARAVGQQGATVMGPPGWLAIGGTADAGLKTLGGVLKEEGKAALGMPAGEGGRGNWRAFGEHYQESMDTPAGRWASEMLEESDRSMDDAGFSLGQRIATDVAWPLGPVNLGRVGRMSRELVGMGGMADAAVVGRGTTIGGGGLGAGGPRAAVTRGPDDLRVALRDPETGDVFIHESGNHGELWEEMANGSMGPEAMAAAERINIHDPGVDPAGFVTADDAFLSRHEAADLIGLTEGRALEADELLEYQHALEAERAAFRAREQERLAGEEIGYENDWAITTTPDVGERRTAIPLAEARRLEDRQRFNYERDSHGIGTRAQLPGPTRGAAQDPGQIETARYWQMHLNDLRDAARTEDPDFALEILAEMDEMEHGSNVAFEARSMAEDFREQGNGRAAATLEQAADDYADRVPESIRDQYTEDAWRSNTNWRTSTMSNQLLPPNMHGARATNARHALVDGQEDIEQEIVRHWEDGNDGMADALAARHGYDIDEDGNLSHPRVEYSSSEVAQARYRDLHPTPERAQPPASLEADTTFEQMHREYLEANRGIDETQFDAVRDTDLNEVQQRIDDHLDHLDFDEAYALARQYEFDINFQGQTSRRGLRTSSGVGHYTVAELDEIAARGGPGEAPMLQAETVGEARARLGEDPWEAATPIADEVSDLMDAGAYDEARALAEQHGYRISNDGGSLLRQGEPDPSTPRDPSEPSEMTEREMRNAQAENLLRFFERAREDGDDELANKLLPLLVAAGASEDDEGGAMAMAGGLVRPGRGRLFRTTGLRDIPKYGLQARVARETGRTVPEAQRIAQEAADAQAESRLPRARANIEKAIPEGESWFNISPLREGMVDELGEEVGGMRFKGTAARLGPTSSGSTVPEEVARTLWAQHGANAGLPIGTLEAMGEGPLPWKPMGHTRYYGGMLPGLERIEELERTGDNVMEAMDPVGQFKTRRMSEAAYGNYQNVPPDMHMGRQFYDTKKPDPYQRRSIERMHQEILGPEYGLDPTPSMAAQWVGGAEETGIRDPRGLMDIFNDEIGKAAQRMGLSDSEFFSRWAKGELPAGSVRMPMISSSKAYVVSPAPAKDFVEQLNRAQKGKYGAFLSSATEESLINDMAVTFLSHDAQAGYAITRGGDVRHVFNMSRRKGTGDMMLSHAKVQGARSLDAFDGFLIKLYRKNGFTETERMGWDDAYAPDNWNLERDGRPDVVGMEYTGPPGDASDAVIRKPRGKKKRGGLNK
jgi:hypothetical protein